MSKEVGVFAKNTKLELSDGETPPGYDEVEGVTKWSPNPGGAGDPEKLEVTSGSTVGLVREKIDGYSDKVSGEVGLEMLCDLSNEVHNTLYEASIAGTDLDFKLTIPTMSGTKVFTFTARVSGFPIDIAFDKIVTVKPKLAIKEDTWAAAA